MASPRIVALVVAREDRARLSNALHRVCSIDFVEHARELWTCVSESALPPRAVVTQPADVAQVASAPTVARIRRQYPGVPVIAYCDPVVDAPALVVQLVHAGAHELLFRRLDDGRATIAAAIAAADHMSVARSLARDLSRLVPTELQPMVEYCLMNGNRPLTVNDVARAIGVHRRTLVNYCERAALPNPAALVSWCRLLLVGSLLVTPGLSVGQIVHTLDFPSSSGVRNLIRRYVDMTAAELRAAGGATHVVAVLEGEIIARRRRLSPP